MVQSTRYGRCLRAATRIAIFVALLWTSPTSQAANDPVREYVDELTAASVTVTVESLVFARERTDLAVNARDYVTLAPLEINRTGKREYFWSGYLWSTIDRRDRQPLLAKGDELILLADGRPIYLRSDGTTVRDHGIGQPPTPAPTRTAEPVLFATDPEAISYVAHATELHIELIHAGSSDNLSLWKGKPAKLGAFVERVAPTK